jgi:hypothetical protein
MKHLRRIYRTIKFIYEYIPSAWRYSRDDQHTLIWGVNTNSLVVKKIVQRDLEKARRQWERKINAYAKRWGKLIQP